MNYTGDIIGVTSVTTYIDRDILVSRDASALTGSVSADLGFPDAGILLPSNLVDTTGVKQFTQEIRLNSAGTGPFQWLVGGYYANVKRDYTQRSEEHTYELQSLMRISYAVFCLKKKNYTAINKAQKHK